MTAELFPSNSADTPEFNSDDVARSISSAADLRTDKDYTTPVSEAAEDQGWGDSALPISPGSELPVEPLKGGVQPLPEIVGNEGSRGSFSGTTSGAFGLHNSVPEKGTVSGDAFEQRLKEARKNLHSKGQ